MKSRPTTITEDRMAEIEIMAENGTITTRHAATQLGMTIQAVDHLIQRLVKMKVLEKSKPVLVGTAWANTYVISNSKPAQASMFSNVARDALVSALFGTETRDPEAAWMF